MATSLADDVCRYSEGFSKSPALRSSLQPPPPSGFVRFTLKTSETKQQLVQQQDRAVLWGEGVDKQVAKCLLEIGLCLAAVRTAEIRNR